MIYNSDTMQQDEDFDRKNFVNLPNQPFVYEGDQHEKIHCKWKKDMHCKINIFCSSLISKGVFLALP